MFCSKCGSQIPEGAAFCPNCGQTVGNRPEMEIHLRSGISRIPERISRADSIRAARASHIRRDRQARRRVPGAGRKL